LIPEIQLYDSLSQIQSLCGGRCCGSFKVLVLTPYQPCSQLTNRWVRTFLDISALSGLDIDSFLFRNQGLTFYQPRQILSITGFPALDIRLLTSGREVSLEYKLRSHSLYAVWLSLGVHSHHPLWWCSPYSKIISGDASAQCRFGQLAHVLEKILWPLCLNALCESSQHSDCNDLDTQSLELNKLEFCQNLFHS